MTDTLEQVVPVLPAPTLDADDNPTQPWQLTSTTRTAWGEQRVWIDGADRTEYGAAGYRTTWADRWTFVRPHWFGEAVIRVAKVRSYAAAPSWCARGKEVRIRHRLADGVTYSADLRSEWRGKVVRVVDADAKTTTLECTGWYQITDWYVQGPHGTGGATDIGTTWAAAVAASSRPGYPWGTDPSAPTTGETHTQRGDWRTVLEYLASIGAALPLWTWRPVNSTTYAPTYVNTAVSPGLAFTLRHGNHGVDVDLVSDLRASPNAIYVTGFSNGKPWELKTINSAGANFHAPISASATVNTLWWNDTTGAIYTDSTGFDATVPRIEVHWQLPAGMTYADAKAIADEFRLAVADPGFTGRIRLASSPAERHLLEIRPDDILTLQGYRGANRTLYVGEVAYDWNGGTPTCELAVDSNGRDLATIEAILDGDLEAATNPFARVQAGRIEGQADGRLVKWSTQAGSGTVPNDDTNGHRHKNGTSLWTVTRGQWNEYIFPAAESGSISDTEIVVSTDGTVGAAVGIEYVAIITDRTVALPPDVNSPLPTDPMAVDAMDQAVEDPALGCQQSWGGTFKQGDGTTVENPAGYGNPAYQWKALAGTVLTGRTFDNADWPFRHEDTSAAPGAGQLVLYVYPMGVGTAKCHMTLTPGPETT